MSHKVAILVHPQIAMFELGCAIELFGLPRPELKSWYQAEAIAIGQANATVHCGVSLKVNTKADLDGYQTLVVPSWPTEQNPIDSRLRKAVLGFLEQGGRVISFCSGAFLLGALGCLDHREATTHWRYAQKFQDRFRKVNYVDNVLYTLSGQIGCSAGSASALDLGLAVIREDFGSQAANSVAKRLVISGHRRGGQSQFVETPLALRASSLDISIEWAKERLNQTISINDLAAKANMSRRNFDRSFRKQLGISPHEWLVTQRIHLARTLLEESSEKLETIAEKSGFSSAGNLRHHFNRTLGLSPRQYRDNFCH